MRTRRGLALIVGLLVVGAFALFLVRANEPEPDGSDRRSAPSEPAEPSKPSGSPKPTPSPTLEQATSPFTGRRLRGGPKPVLVTKIDNVAQARPHAGVDRADLVYLEPVEGGLSRLMAVFSSNLPERLGPVRSARESDLDILRQFGKPAFAFSGANSTVLSLLEQAPLFDVSPTQAGGDYARSDDRSAPYNLYVDAKKLLARAPQASKASDIGFRFGRAPDGGRNVESMSVSYPAFEIGVHWSASLERWRISMDGEPYRPAAPATVVVQRVRLLDSEHRQMRELGSPYVETIGAGKATVLRNGKAYDARWSRPSASDGTTFRDDDGAVINFTRGPVWVIYDGS